MTQVNTETDEETNGESAAKIFHERPLGSVGCCFLNSFTMRLAQRSLADLPSAFQIYNRNHALSQMIKSSITVADSLLKVSR